MPLSDLQIQTLARDAMQRAQAGDFAAAEPLLAQLVAERGRTPARRCTCWDRRG